MSAKQSELEHTHALLIEEIKMQVKLINKVNELVKQVTKLNIDPSFANDINLTLSLSKNYEERVQQLLRK